MLGGLGLEVMKHVVQREAVLRPERQYDGVLGCRRLQLEVEAATKALAQREAPRPVHTAAERRVQHELHPACLVEEPLEHQRLLRGDDARSEEHTSELQSPCNLVCRLLLEKKKINTCQ